ncbi:amidohydrolase family protein [Staphylococcus pettenkoferi]|uniref:amidohydrolase family protein n=1 Tax=Staphylococcus pettenkoferi TaxID=170573 RepID=UPI001BD018B9|nr:amidohydrolase family protein [Staphylococcus pettenkoferi]MCY1627117.1 amidohydrolase family protein [Staphylococcus pettenkoferi]
MSINLQQVPAVDVHCHPFVAPEKPHTVESFLNTLSLSVIPDMFTKQDISENGIVPGMNMYLQLTIRRLAQFFQCEPHIEAVVEARNQHAEDYANYTQSLYQDANITGMIVDYGYPVPHIPKADSEQTPGFHTFEIYRIEPVMEHYGAQCQTFTEFKQAYYDDLLQTLQRPDVVGLKSIIAYRSGLEVLPKDEDKAADAYATFRNDTRAAVKPLRDYCMHLAMEACTETDKVMHIHTGVGDGEVVLPKASPSLLIDMLRTPKYSQTKVHFVHGGYPWMEEAAFITSILPNVYMDISLQIPFAGHGAKRILSTVFEFAPFDKVMFGSDCFSAPEMNWLAAKLFRQDLTEVLETWVERDYMDEHMAQEIGEMVLYRNFERVYQDAITACSDA